jgi:hypothetical protein
LPTTTPSAVIEEADGENQSQAATKNHIKRRLSSLIKTARDQSIVRHDEDMYTALMALHTQVRSGDLVVHMVEPT